MSAENPSEQRPEGKEWQGQNWEYITLVLSGEGRDTRGRFLVSDDIGNPLVDQYTNKIEELENKFSKKGLLGKTGGRITLNDVLNLLGQNGWELVASAPTFSVTTNPGDSLLFLKRPIPSSG